MSTWIRSSAITRFSGMVATVWLCGVASVWAGTGGSDSGVQTVLNSVCADVGISTTSCPQVPTVTQAILAISGFENAAPDFVRGPQGNFQSFGACAPFLQEPASPSAARRTRSTQSTRPRHPPSMCRICQT